MKRSSLNNKTPIAGWEEKMRRELNKEQYLFATCDDASILGIAGPGSGKTRALTYRVANLLQKNIPPEKIMLVTFTNKAAEEMKDRVKELLEGSLPSGLWDGTFHSLGARFLRRHASLVNRTPGFSIMDEEDRKAMLRSALAESKIELSSQEKNTFIKRGVLNRILSSAKNSGLPLAEYMTEYEPRMIEYLEVFSRVQALYEQKKAAANSFDFDDLLTEWLQLLENNKDIRTRYQEQFDHILVDEFQDTNAIQNRIVLLLGEKCSVCLVGDDSQSIYSFRCAEIGNILNFPQQRLDCNTIKLVQNYRSTPEILELANCSIENNLQQVPKELASTRSEGTKPQLFIADDNFQEAQFIVNTIEDMYYNDGQNLNEIAVLYRSSYLSQDVEMALLSKRIPYLTFGGLKFLNRAHIKDILAWLKIIYNQWDELAWQRVALMHEGIGEATFQKLWHKLRAYPHPVSAALSKEVTPSRGVRGWEQLLETLHALNRLDSENVPSLIRTIMECYYGDYLMKHYPDDYTERTLGIERLAAYGERCSSLQNFLESLLLEESLILEGVRDSSPEKDFVTLSTIHSAKGKEWKTVFVIGLNEGRFPSPQGINNMEEERRLFYVATTRAKDYLFLLASRQEYRRWESLMSGPSLFLKELPFHCYETISDL